MIDTIESAQLHVNPVPWFIADDVLSSDLLEEMHRNWPVSGFAPEVRCNYVYDLSSSHDPFWASFCAGPCMDMCHKAMARFRPWITARYHPDVEVQPAYICLMQADPDYPGHHPHTHHYHDPEWCATLLLYLDRDSCGVQGTTLLSSNASDLDDEARIAADVSSWPSRDFGEVTTVDFTSGRLFAMLDTPISYHCVKAALSNAVGNRRIFRVHLKVPNHHAEGIYGVSMDAYRKMRSVTTTDPVVLGWLKRDIEELRGVQWTG